MKRCRQAYGDAEDSWPEFHRAERLQLGAGSLLVAGGALVAVGPGWRHPELVVSF